MSLKFLLDATGTVNVALHRPASQSSLSEWSKPDDSRRAVNGHRTGDYAFHTLIELNPWWQVDLEAPYPLDAIIVWNRDGDFAARACDLSIEVSTDGVEWVPVFRGRSYFGGELTSRPLVHLLDGRLYARFVKISLQGETALHLDEVEVLVSKDRLTAESFWQEVQSSNPETRAERLAKRSDYDVYRGRSASAAEPKISALKLRRSGRFGNNFHQLMNACVIAKALNLTDIILDDEMLPGPAPLLPIGGLRFRERADENDCAALRGPYYFIDAFEPIFARVSTEALHEILTKIVQPLYRDILNQASAPSPNAMHFHFRSGDLFRDLNPSQSYTQPPLAFYRLALTHAVANFGVDNAVIVYEDKRNPCVDAFLEFLGSIDFPYTAHSGTLPEDLNRLLSARIVCQGFGTFIEAILCLSRHAGMAYAFRDVEAFPGGNKPRGTGITQLLLKKGLTLHVVKDTADDYISKHRWSNSPEQRQMMLSYPLDGLELSTLERLTIGTSSRISPSVEIP